MSLSKNTGKTESAVRPYKLFQMERFDNPDHPVSYSKVEKTFEPYCAADNKAATFRYLYCDDNEQGLKGAGGMGGAAKERTALIEREAYEKGFAQGEKDGLEMGNKKLDKILDRMQGTLNDMLSHRQEFIKMYEKQILRLICTISEKVAKVAVRLDQHVVQETIFQAFNLAADLTETTIRVSPEDVEYVKEIRPEFFDRIKELRSITIESDPSISAGGCFMETAFGNVDARLETQLAKITKAVEQAFEEESSRLAHSESPSA